jgi:hypothetical protein
MSCVVVSRCKFGSDLRSGIAMSVVPELLSVIDFVLLIAVDIVEKKVNADGMKSLEATQEKVGVG